MLTWTIRLVPRVWSWSRVFTSLSAPTRDNVALLGKGESQRVAEQAFPALSTWLHKWRMWALVSVAGRREGGLARRPALLSQASEQLDEPFLFFGELNEETDSKDLSFFLPIMN